MNTPGYINVAQYPKRVRWFMMVAWVVIAVKCLLVWWAIGHWNVPVHPMWVIAPTVMFAALVTGIWLTHRPD